MQLLRLVNVNNCKPIVQGGTEIGKEDGWRRSLRSLIVDGATDSVIQEQDIVFVRVCVAGKVAVSFLSIENTPKADAARVTASIVRAVEVSLETTMPIFNKKFVSIATDGASVMTGFSTPNMAGPSKTTMPTLSVMSSCSSEASSRQPGVQAAFLKDGKALVTVLEDMGNPFLERIQHLLDTQVAETVRRIENIGNEQFTKFVTERLEECTTPVTPDYLCCIWTML